MRKASTSWKALTLAAALVLLAAAPAGAAEITGGYPGHPNTWSGLTTNTIIEIELDAPVAMVGGVPDITFCVKKAELAGLDFVFTEGAVDVGVSGDGKTIRLYPYDELDTGAMYAYKVEHVAFEGGGSDWNFAGCFNTGDDPWPVYTTELDEDDMCTDEGGALSEVSPWCARCHTGWMVGCTITP